MLMLAENLDQESNIRLAFKVGNNKSPDHSFVLNNVATEEPVNVHFITLGKQLITDTT